MDRDYVLGTHDEEISRLGLQHRVWRPRALDAWRRAGFNVGHRLLDVGCGPGHASFDLADLVGPSGRVMGIERSRRFLDALNAAATHRGVDNIQTFELDLDDDAFPVRDADGAWCRWVLCFVKKPREVLAKMAGSLRAGGSLVIHEYFDYSTWRLAPRCMELEEFVGTVMQSWRAQGGEPDIALNLPGWLSELGLAIRELRPIVDVVGAANFVWQWPASFVQVGIERLVSLGHFTRARASEISAAFAAAEAAPHTHMITPAVLEIIATKEASPAV